MQYVVTFAPEAEEQLLALYRYIAGEASPGIAQRYVAAPGLRITHYRRRAVIAYAIDDAAASVTILGVFYGGRDYQHDLRDDEDA